MLFRHCVARAASRAACTAGNSRARRIPMIAITTSNSTSVNARRTMTISWQVWKRRGGSREDSQTILRTSEISSRIGPVKRLAEIDADVSGKEISDALAATALCQGQQRLRD